MPSNSDLDLERLRERITTVRKSTRINAMDPSGTYTSFNLMTDLTTIVRQMISGVFEIKTKPRRHKSDLPVAIFLYGGPARGEMTTYSDIDVHFMDEVCSEATRTLKKETLQALGTFGFGKVDDPGWENLKTLEEYAKKSITEANQVIDSSYVCGNNDVANGMRAIAKRYDTLDRNVRNIFFQWFYLDFYYSTRSTDAVPNVKYGRGGYRELLTFDWFDKTMELFTPGWNKNPTVQPLIKRSVMNLHDNGLVSHKDFLQIAESVDFVILLRNEMLHVNQGTADQGITHLDLPTRRRLWDTSESYFRTKGVYDAEQISTTFGQHRTRIRQTKELMWDQILKQESLRRGRGWHESILATINTKSHNEIRHNAASSSDNLLQVAAVWGAHYNGDRDFFETLARKYVSTHNWEVLASLACSTLCPDDVLHELASRCKETGLGYVLRIIGRNPNASRATLEYISGDSALDERYRVVARNHLEKGLDYATKRS